ncbi:MAG: phage holin family protein [Flavobacteriales bacterium]|nr:phage holin family protein [Flavobacteriales bacterium]
MKSFIRWVGKLFASALAVMIVAYILPGVHVKDFITGLLVAVVLSLLNNLLKPILIILTIPVTVLTFGFFLLVINSAIILLVGSLVPNFRVDGFWWALLFSVLLSFVNSLFESIDRNHTEDKNEN